MDEGRPVPPTKRGAAMLVKEFFGLSNQETIALPKEDRIQLGSAIAKTQRIPPEALEFTPVEY